MMESASQDLDQLQKSQKLDEGIKHKVSRIGFREALAFNIKQRDNIREAMKEQYKKHGGVVRVGAGKLQLTQLFGPEWNQVVYQNREGAFSSRQGWHFVLKRIFPGSVMAMDGSEHLYQRRIMSQAFKKPKLVAYLDHMNPFVAEGIGNWQVDDNFHVFPHVKELTLELATRIFMGVEPDEKSKKMNQAFMDTVEASIAPIRYPIPPFQMWKGVKGREFLVKEFNRLLPEKRKSDTPDFFSQFCHAESEDGEKFTDSEIVDHMIFLMMAAHDTTTSTLTTMFYALAKNPEWQERLRKNSQNLGKTFLDFEDLSALQEMEWVMKESLRMFPPLPTMPRMVVKDVEHYGVQFKKGNFISVSPVHSHYMEKYWSNPDKFDPERWSPERAEYKNHAYQWIPFGGGAHMCVGQHFADLQVKAVMHQILLQYSWGVPEGYEVPYQLMPIAKPKDGLPVSLKNL
jgi:cytochrome P450